MPCATIVFDGGTGMICGSAVVPCSQCGRSADYLCDWPLGKGKTCDAPLCERHAISQGLIANQLRLFDDPPDPESEVHFCPTHSLMARS